MNRFSISTTPLEGLKVLKRQHLGDDRGYFSRLFCSDEFSSIGWKAPIAQINHSYTAVKGTIRGMHYQSPPHSEMKLVSCLQGEIVDIAVDIRIQSETFLQHYAINLSAENQKALLIPQGFAHGFQTLTANVELLYFHSAAYNQNAEGGLNPEDPAIAIKWPLPVGEISEKDKSQPYIKTGFKGVTL